MFLLDRSPAKNCIKQVPVTIEVITMTSLSALSTIANYLGKALDLSLPAFLASITLRHGQTELNIEGIVQGKIEMAPTDAGEAQACATVYKNAQVLCSI